MRDKEILSIDECSKLDHHTVTTKSGLMAEETLLERVGGPEAEPDGGRQLEEVPLRGGSDASDTPPQALGEICRLLREVEVDLGACGSIAAAEALRAWREGFAAGSGSTGALLGRIRAELEVDIAAKRTEVAQLQACGTWREDDKAIDDNVARLSASIGEWPELASNQRSSVPVIPNDIPDFDLLEERRRGFGAELAYLVQEQQALNREASCVAEERERVERAAAAYEAKRPSAEQLARRLVTVRSQSQTARPRLFGFRRRSGEAEPQLHQDELVLEQLEKELQGGYEALTSVRRQLAERTEQAATRRAEWEKRCLSAWQERAALATAVEGSIMRKISELRHPRVTPRTPVQKQRHDMEEAIQREELLMRLIAAAHPDVD